MRVVIVGATGNAGTALIRRLNSEPGLDVAGVARRIPPAEGVYSDVEWHAADVANPGALDESFRAADAVVNLAWQIQPSHDQDQLFRTNVLGAREVIRACLRTGVKTLVQASSVGVYATGPKHELVSERWPHTGIRSSSYSRHKALVERLLDQAEADHPTLRVVRVRPGLIFQRDAGTEIARYFAGPLLPARLLRHQRIPLIPDHPRLRLQAVHADDVADAYAKILLSDLHGAFNLAADPILDTELAAAAFRGWRVPVPTAALTTAASLSWLLRLQPTDLGWVRLALAAPLMSSQRAETELGWRPRQDALTALRELLTGMSAHAGTPSPPLRPSPGQPGRLTALLRGRLPGTGNPY
jgi:UDP-glucose 4-epimerase